MITIDYKSHPRKPFKELLRQYGGSTHLILDDVLLNEKTYTYIYQDMIDILKYGMEYKAIRELPIFFMIHRPEDGGPAPVIYSLQCRHFLSNLVIWYAFMKMDKVELMSERHIIDWHGKDIKFIASFLDEEVIPIHDGDFHELNAIIDEIIFHIKAISDAFCLIFGYSASIYDIMMAERKNPRIHELLYQHIDVTMQPKELEDKLHEVNTELMQCFANSDSDLSPLLLSGKNISADQFREIFLKIGLKADMSSRTVPWFIDNNFLITGIDNPAAAFIINGSGRTALINGKLAMSKPGALSKKMNHSATSVVLRHDHEWCNSARPVYYTITDDNVLKMLDKRYYYDEMGQIHLLDWRKDKHLIGGTYGFRSPCTCTSTEGICEGCYGALFGINDDLFSQGSLAATKCSEPYGQLVLKSKHVQTTNSAEIVFDDSFNANFDLVGTEIMLNENIEDGLMLQLGQVKLEETDDGEVHYVDEFFLIDFNGEVKAHVQEQNKFPMYFSSEMELAWKQYGDKPIPIERFDSDDDNDVSLFNIEIKSDNVALSYQQALAIFDSKDHLGYMHDLDGLCQKIGDIMMGNGMAYNFVHYEMIVRSMLRRKSDEMLFPDFSPNGDHEDYVVLRLTSTLRKNPSPIIRLSTGWLKSNLIGTALYKADAPSHLDPLFVPVLMDFIDE